MSIELLIWLLPLPPLLAFLLIVLFTRRNHALSHTLGVGSVLVSWLGSMVIFANAITTEHLGSHPFGSSFQPETAGYRLVYGLTRSLRQACFSSPGPY